jgi:hypothetical protein
LAAERCDAAGLSKERVPGVAARVDDVVVAVEEAMAEEALAQVEPDAFDRVQLWAVGRQMERRDRIGPAELDASKNRRFSVSGRYERRTALMSALSGWLWQL